MSREVEYQCGSPNCNEVHTTTLYDGGSVELGPADEFLERERLPEIAQDDNVLLLMDGGWRTPGQNGMVNGYNRKHHVDMLILGTPTRLFLLRYLPAPQVAGWEIVSEAAGEYDDVFGPGTTIEDVEAELDELSEESGYDWRDFRLVAIGGKAVRSAEELLAMRDDRTLSSPWMG